MNTQNNNDGGPAFPGLHPSKECHYQDAGMTLRDYFAGQALAAMAIQICVEKPAAEFMATSAYKIADAMLAARKEGYK